MRALAGLRLLAAALKEVVRKTREQIKYRAQVPGTGAQDYFVAAPRNFHVVGLELKLARNPHRLRIPAAKNASGHNIEYILSVYTL